jgi:hypothetical protein
VHAHAQHDRSVEIQRAVSSHQRKRICPLSVMLHELERTEEADGNEDGNGEKQNDDKEDRERARREELG